MTISVAAMATQAGSQAPDPQVGIDLPWAERAVELHGDTITAVSLGLADDRGARLATRRAAARARAERRGCAAIHQWVDASLSRVQARAVQAQAAHQAIDQHCHARRARPLANGDALVEVALEVAHLRAAAPLQGVPWAP